jgi:antagonist of KipI
MADRQTTGGYAQIATVITPDLEKAAQAKPGAKIKFQKVSINEAQRIYTAYEKKISEIQSKLQKD